MIIELTFILQAATPQTLGKEKQQHRAESDERNDEVVDLDSDRSFTFAVLDSQSFMRKITLRIIQAALSHIGTRWNAAANKGTMPHLCTSQ